MLSAIAASVLPAGIVKTRCDMVKVGMYYGDDYEYASRRLRDTVILHNTKGPCLVRNLFNDIKKISVEYIPLLEKGENLCVDNLSEFDLEPPKLGNVNSRYLHCDYVARKPMRKDWRQGISSNQMVVVSSRRSPRDYSWKEYAKTFVGDYPRFDECLSVVIKGGGIAFSRDFSLQSEGANISLHYRQHLVGRVEKNTPILEHKFFFLSEQLSIDLGK